MSMACLPFSCFENRYPAESPHSAALCSFAQKPSVVSTTPWRELGAISGCPLPVYSPPVTLALSCSFLTQVFTSRAGPSLQSPPHFCFHPRVLAALSSVFSFSCAHAQSCPTQRPPGLSPTRLLCPWDFPGKSTESGCHFLLQGIFPTQGSNPCLLRLLHWQVILYH